LISAAGEQDHALLIDCRSLRTRAVPVPADASVVVLDTATRRGLVDSAYNERRAQCETAARFFGVRALRDVDLATFSKRAGGLDPVTRRRAQHVVTENARTLAAADALAGHDLHTVGALMNESHASLRDAFEVSRTELDVMVSIAREQPGCYGARMTGAGFGGCAVALVDAARAEGFAGVVARDYHTAVGLTPAVYLCLAAPGASLESA
ncbi:MAG: galactokinase, partial [Gemmatimonadota bacterium]|nr:galactokinase [Gemmatimonadota bacterium]